jgi:hemoglobin-like flavoprotein
VFRFAPLNRGTMTANQITLVQTSWEKVVPISETAARLFYGKLFELDPELKPLFKNDIVAQGKKLMQMITLAVRGLNDLGKLVPVVQDLGRGHVAYGVRLKDYDIVGSSLLWTLEQGLGAAFTPETKQAWVEVYNLLATTMKDAAAKTLK